MRVKSKIDSDAAISADMDWKDKLKYSTEGKLFQFDVNRTVIVRSAINSLLVQLIVR